MKSDYIDTKSIIQVIGSIYQNPNILDNEEYSFNEDDFPQEFHRVMFGSIYNLYQLGATSITINAIEDYLSNRDKQYGIYKSCNGAEWLQKCTESVSVATFDHYYKRMKKFTLLRMYDNIGVNVRYLYDPSNILDVKKKQAQEDWLDNHSLEEIADIIDDKINTIRTQYAYNAASDIVQAGIGAEAYFEDLQKNPNVGYPMLGKYMNKIFRGARLGCVYLRSAPTNFGKSRYMIADACSFACNELYDTEKNEWIANNTPEPTIYIATEQSVKEIQTMMWAFIAGVPEGHIHEQVMTANEKERVKKAIQIIERSPLYIKELPDFSLQDVESVIKLGLRKYGVKYICFDYIHTSIKILSEISGKAKVSSLREDNILFMLSVRLKDLAQKYGVFILTSTQLNGEYVEAKIFDQNLLRGAKSIADKVDAGMILLPVTDQDRESLKLFCQKNEFEMPTLKISIYKNRGGKYNHMFLWACPNLDICQINIVFATSYFYEPIEIEDLIINVRQSKDWESAF